MTVLCLAYPHQHGFKAHHPFKVYGERREGRFDATHLYVAYSSAFGSFHMSPRNGQHPCISLTTMYPYGLPKDFHGIQTLVFLNYHLDNLNQSYLFFSFGSFFKVYRPNGVCRQDRVHACSP